MARPVEWFYRAKEKLAEARSEKSQGRPQNAFEVARVAAELLLKSLLVAQELQEDQFISHDHDWLCQQIDWSRFPEADRMTLEQASYNLTYFTMESGVQCSFEMTGAARYPDNITPDDAERTIQIAQRIMSEVQKEIYSNEPERNYDHIFDMLLILASLLNAAFLAAFQVWSTLRPRWEGWMKPTSWIFGFTAPLLYVMPIYSLAKACPPNRKILKAFLRLAAYGGTLAILNLSYNLFVYSSLTLMFPTDPQMVQSIFQIPFYVIFGLSLVMLFFLCYRLVLSQETTYPQQLAALVISFLSYSIALFLPILMTF